MVDRKRQHIELTNQSQISKEKLFSYGLDYEPMLGPHPKLENYPSQLGKTFLGKFLKAPLWVSSMTGGTQSAYEVNSRLATSCAKYGIGMGLGSCRSLLEGSMTSRDFDLREKIGDELPFYANIGVAQLEQLVLKSDLDPLYKMLDSLCVDGLIVHVNPLQEFCQPEGDRFELAPIETLKRLYELGFSRKLIVKEVGQGMGPRSLEALMKLPLQAIEFGAFGGTNFSELELLRGKNQFQNQWQELSFVGHSACQMVNQINRLLGSKDHSDLTVEFIISGGIRSFLEGYELVERLEANGVIGMGKPFLDAALLGQSELDRFIENYILGLQLANHYFRVKQD